MKILISQKAPSNPAPFENVRNKYNATLDFRPFFIIEPVSAKEFRAEHINLPDYTAVVFSSRHAIDAYFKLAEEMRFKVPETMKYFCTTEAVAMYLQKHIVYRKRKIFFGDGTTSSLIGLIGPKHKDEKFLITTTVGANTESICNQFEAAKLSYSVSALVKPVNQDLKDVDMASYDIVVMLSTSDLDSLQENHPGYVQGNTKIIAFGKSIATAAEAAGLTLALKAPTPQAKSVAGAIEFLLESSN